MSWLNETQELKYSMDFSSDEENPQEEKFVSEESPLEENFVSNEENHQEKFVDLSNTEELQYPQSDPPPSSESNESSSEESTASEESTDESEPDLSNLKGYDFEPVCDPRPVSHSTDEGELDEDTSDSRIGNRDWCVCGKCEAMESSIEESLCCKDTNEVPEELFEGRW